MPHGTPKATAPQRPQEVTDLEWLLLELERIDGCEDTKRRVMALLQAQVGRVIRFTFRALIRPDQVRMATRLLDQRTPVREIRDRLVVAYGCSPRHAYNVIGQALRDRAPQAPQPTSKQIPIFDHADA